MSTRMTMLIFSTSAITPSPSSAARSDPVEVHQVEPRHRLRRRRATTTTTTSERASSWRAVDGERLRHWYRRAFARDVANAESDGGDEKGRDGDEETRPRRRDDERADTPARAIARGVRKWDSDDDDRVRGREDRGTDAEERQGWMDARGSAQPGYPIRGNGAKEARGSETGGVTRAWIDQYERVID